MPSYLNRVVYLTEAQKTTLFNTGTITVNGTTVNYDSNDLYITADPQVPDTVTIAGNTINLGGSLSTDTLLQSLGLTKVMRFIGVTTSNITNGSTTNPVAFADGNKTAITGDVVLKSDLEYLWTGSAWELLGSSSSYKVTQTAVTDSATINTTMTKFVAKVTQDAQGVISVVKADLPSASTGTAGIVQLGAGASQAAPGNHTHAFSELTSKPTTISGYGITDAKIANGTITLGTNTITPLTSHQSVNNAAATLSWGTAVTVATIGGTSITVKLPSNPNTDHYDWSDITNKPSTFAPASHSHSYLPLTGGTVTDTLILSKNTDAAGSTANGVALIVGGTQTAAHLELDSNEIIAKANGTTLASLWFNELCEVTTAGLIKNAVWNDYAEYRQATSLEPGRVCQENDNGCMTLADARLIPGCQVISDTFGYAEGETEKAKTPIAVAGRVLTYTYRDRSEYHAGMAVCSAPNGTVDIMSREEIIQYPDAIIGIVSEIPDYATWGTGNVNINGRIWIKVR